MPGIKALRKLLIGKEASTDPGTEVDATTFLRMTGTIADTRERMFPEEDIGLLSGLDRSYVAKLGSELQIEGPATFEQLPYILEMGVQTVSPAQDGAGSGYIYSYAFPTTAPNTPAYYTIEGGDNTKCEVSTHNFVSEFTLEGTMGEAWNMSATIIGRTVAGSTYTALASSDIPAVSELLFGKSKLYINASTDTVGTTLVSQTLLGATLTATTGFTPVFTANGELYFDFVKNTAPEVTLNVTFEHNASAVAEKEAWRNGTPRQIRLLIEGDALTSAGTTYSKKTVKIDLAGKWESFEALSDQDGNDTVTGLFRARYNQLADLFAEIVVVNELTTLP